MKSNPDKLLRLRLDSSITVRVYSIKFQRKYHFNYKMTRGLTQDVQNKTRIGVIENENEVNDMNKSMSCD